MVEENIGRLLIQSKSQQAQIDGFRREVASMYKSINGLQEELGALRECMLSSGLLRCGQLAAHLHKRRFENLLRRCTCAWDVLLTDVVHAPGVLHPILQFAGVTSIRHFAACATALRNSAEMSQQYAARPTRLYLLGGSAGDHMPLNSALRFDVPRGEWEELSPMPTARDVLTSAAVGNQIYSIGGTDGERPFGTVECYNTETGEWSPVQPMPTARGGLAAAAVNEMLYTVGGSDGTKALGTVERYHVRDDVWQKGPSLLTPRRGLAVAVLGRILYAIGGSHGSETLSSVESLNTDHGVSWISMPSMSTARRAAAAAALKGKIYVVGGAGGSDEDPSLRATECFDPERHMWEVIAPMPSARRGLSLAPIDGFLLALGGSDGTRTYSAIEAYNPSLGCWEVRTPMPTRRGYFGVAVTQTLEVLGLTVGPAAAQELRGALRSYRRNQFGSEERPQIGSPLSPFGRRTRASPATR